METWAQPDPSQLLLPILAMIMPKQAAAPPQMGRLIQLNATPSSTESMTLINTTGRPQPTPISSARCVNGRSDVARLIRTAPATPRPPVASTAPQNQPGSAAGCHLTWLNPRNSPIAAKSSPAAQNGTFVPFPSAFTGTTGLGLLFLPVVRF